MSLSAPDMHRIVARAVNTLKHGGLVAYPTDTLYGLGADIFDPEAVDRVFQVKGRPRHEALPVLIGSLADLDRVTGHVPQLLHSFAERFWPGPLTLVLERRPEVPDTVTGGQDTIAVRLPGHAIPRVLAMESGSPITGTSANRSGGPEPRTAQEVQDQLGDGVDLVVDGGRCPGGVASTILDLTTDPPFVVRQGAIPEEALRAISPVGLETAER